MCVDCDLPGFLLVLVGIVGSIGIAVNMGVNCVFMTISNPGQIRRRSDGHSGN